MKTLFMVLDTTFSFRLFIHFLRYSNLMLNRACVCIIGEIQNSGTSSSSPLVHNTLNFDYLHTVADSEKGCGWRPRPNSRVFLFTIISKFTRESFGLFVKKSNLFKKYQPLGTPDSYFMMKLGNRQRNKITLYLK